MDKKLNKSKGYSSITPRCDSITPVDLSERKPPLFSLGINDFNTLPLITNNELLSEKEKDLITAMFDMCGLDDEKVTDIERIGFTLGQPLDGGRGKQIGSSAIRKRLKRLESMGVIEKTYITGALGKRKNHHVVMYVLSPVTEINILPAPPSTNEIMQLDMFEGGQLLDELYDYSHRFDSLFCQLLSACLPIDGRTSMTVIDTFLYLYGRKIAISVASRTGYRIPTVGSIKTVIAILTIVEKIIKERQLTGQPIGVKFVVDIGEVLMVKQLPKLSGNRRTVVDQVSSWEATTFMFKDLPEEVKEHFHSKHGIEVSGFQHFQLFTQLSLLAINRNNTKHPTHIGFELPQMLVDSIADQGVFGLFTVTPQIMKENDPFTIAYHMFCRKNIGQATYPLILKKRDVWKRMASSISYSKFEKRFDRMILKKIEEENVDDEEYLKSLKEFIDANDGKYIKQVSVLGYLVSIDKGVVTTVKNPDDPYVGIKSKHQAIKQKAERLASSEAEVDYHRNNPDSLKDKK